MASKKPQRTARPKGRAAPAKSAANGQPDNGQPDNGQQTRRANYARATILAASDLPTTEQLWLWDRRILLGAVTLLAGDQGAGKSTLATCLAAAVSRGRELPGEERILLAARGVLWLGREEDAASAVRPRLAAHCADLTRVYFPEHCAEGRRRRLTLPLHAGELIKHAKDTDALLIVLDPITGYVAEDALADSGQTARAVLQSLTDVCAEVGCAAVAIKHPRKGMNGSLIERISGSREWVHVPRTVLYLGSAGKDASLRYLLTLKPGPPQRPPALSLSLASFNDTVRVVWGGEVTVGPDEITGDTGTAADRDALGDARAFLRDRLSEGEMRVKDLQRWAEDSGLSPITLRRAKQSEGVTAHVIGSNEDRYWVWRAPEGGWR
jgi:energy-coupling factor transporter ATP-binding protein EcfA2